MVAQSFDIDSLRVAKPCPVGWDTMKGDERKRRCDMCELSVYNVSEMTEAEIRKLIANPTERICARIYRRADGTVITRDCPVGLRAYRKRIVKFTGAALSMIIGMFSTGYGQVEQKTGKKNETQISADNKRESAAIKGLLVDQNGAVMPGWKIELKPAGQKKGIKQKTDDNGEFSFSSLKPGKYVLEVPKPGGFKRIREDIDLGEGKEVTINLLLKFSGTVTVGIIGEPLIDFKKVGGTTVEKDNAFRKLPWQ